MNDWINEAFPNRGHPIYRCRMWDESKTWRIGKSIIISHFLNQISYLTRNDIHLTFIVVRGKKGRSPLIGDHQTWWTSFKFLKAFFLTYIYQMEHETTVHCSWTILFIFQEKKRPKRILKNKRNNLKKNNIKSYTIKIFLLWILISTSLRSKTITIVLKRQCKMSFMFRRLLSFLPFFHRCYYSFHIIMIRIRDICSIIIINYILHLSLLSNMLCRHYWSKRRWRIFENYFLRFNNYFPRSNVINTTRHRYLVKKIYQLVNAKKCQLSDILGNSLY